jgi:hypothetical protein
VRDASLSEAVPQLFNEEGYVQSLHEAVDCLVQAEAFELGVELLSMMFTLHKSTGQFRKLVAVGKQLSDLAEKASVATEGNTRLFNNYYRVGFYGPRFGPLNETQYVYREPSSVRLADFQNRMVVNFSAALNSEVKPVSNKPIEEQGLAADGHYIQIVSVNPIWVPSKFREKKTPTPFDKQHMVDHFGFEAPFAPNGGKISEDVDKQWKRRTIYIVPKYYPAVLRRLRVKEVRYDDLEPLGCAIDLLESRINAIETELSIRPPNTKTLQIVLQGSIMLQVNAGPLAIVKVFLANADTFNPHKIAVLKERMEKFVNRCEFALKMNEKLIGEDQRAYQEAMTEAFYKFKNEALQHLDLSS